MSHDPDRLFKLLPAVIQMRDDDAGGPLKELLQVIAEQAGVVEDEIRQLYDDWFIETCQEWLVPYIGDLVGYTPVFEAGQPGNPNAPREQARNRILFPRREVANTVRYRRRKGALALLEELAYDVTGWRTRAVEFYTLLGWTQHLNHCRPDRGRTADLRCGDALDRLNGPFDEIAHTVDVRRIDSPLTPGRYNIPSVGLFIWRLKSYPVTGTQATAIEGRPNLFTFSALGNDTPLFVSPEPEPDPAHIAGELNVPMPVRQRAFDMDRRASPDYYGEGKSLAIYADGWEEAPEGGLVPVKQIVPADLSGWSYEPRDGTVAVDPVLGRIVFPRNQVAWSGLQVQVNYHYGFSADIGGGEYDRPLDQPETATVYRVTTSGEDSCQYGTIGEALDTWGREKPRHAVIELGDSLVYTEPLGPIELTMPGQSLQVRAAQKKRPIIRLLDYRSDQPDALTFHLAQGCTLTLDGLLVTGNAITVEAYKEPTLPKKVSRKAAAAAQAQESRCAAEEPAGSTTACTPEQGKVIVRHTTLVPGWTLDVECEPRRPSEPSLVIDRVNVGVTVEHSIIGSIMVNLDAVKNDPIPVHISDSVVDATGVDCKRPECVALSDADLSYAHAVLTIERATVIGRVLVHAIALGENSIFYAPVRAARSQTGCVRFSYVTPGSRMPRRYECQPDLIEQALANRPGWSGLSPDEQAAHQEAEQRRVRPVFNSVRYGRPTYCQLAQACAEEITRGADDESEMGAFHDLYQPQRAANLRARLAEYSPAGMEAGLIFVS